MREARGLTDWTALSRELDRWAADGLRATFWWRDDDARAPGPALDALLESAATENAPLALAVIPADADPALNERVAGLPNLAILQHGYAHQNHAPASEKKQELGPHRPFPSVIGELATGQARLERIFGSRFLPILVPPWNRIAPALVPMLPAFGYRGLSVYQPRARREAAPGLIQANAHIDIVDWAGERGFVGEEAALGMAIGHLAARRAGHADAREPTGLLTHHLVHDSACRAFLDRFLAAVATHPAAEWLEAGAVFAPSAPSRTGAA